MKTTSFLLLLTRCLGCRVLDQKIIRDSDLNPINASAVAIPKQATLEQPSSSVLPVPPVEAHYVTWTISDLDTTNMPQENVEFDVEKLDNVYGGWYLYCRTNQPPVPFYTTNEQGYFRVGAHWVNL